MSTPPQPNPNNQPNPQPNPSQPNPQPAPVRIKRNQKSLFFLFLIMMAVIYVLIIHANTHHTGDTPTQTPIITTTTDGNTNVTMPQNILEYNFSLTNTLYKNELAYKNGTFYIQFAGYFNTFPGSSPQSISGNVTMLYVTITIYNGSQTESVVLPLAVQLNYNHQKYFVYQVAGNILQLKELATNLAPNEVIQFQFYTKNGEIQGYTVW